MTVNVIVKGDLRRKAAIAAIAKFAEGEGVSGDIEVTQRIYGPDSRCGGGIQYFGEIGGRVFSIGWEIPLPEFGKECVDSQLSMPDTIRRMSY